MRRNLFTEHNVHIQVMTSPIASTTAKTGNSKPGDISVLTVGSQREATVMTAYMTTHARIAEITPTSIFLRKNGRLMKDHFAPTSFIE